MPRRRAWADFFVDLNLANEVPQSVDLLTQAPDLDTITVARIIGRLHAAPDDLTSQIDGRMIVDIGIGVASVEGFAVAASAGLPIVSGGASSPPRGWLYRDEMSIIKVHSTGTTFEIMKDDRVRFDLGAMRKIDKGVLFFIAEADGAAGTAFNVKLTGPIRCMILT